MPPLLVLLFSSQFGGKHPTVTHTRISADSFFPGMMGYLILMLMTPAYNCFAYESKGIRNYYTAPIRFRDVLLAKNLMYALILVFEIVISITLLSIRIGLPSSPVFAATILALVFAVTGQFAHRRLDLAQLPEKTRIRLDARAAWVRSVDLDCIRRANSLGGNLHGNSFHRALDGKSVVAGGSLRSACGSIARRIFCGARRAQRGGGKEKGSLDRNSVPENNPTFSGSPHRHIGRQWLANKSTFPAPGRYALSIHHDKAESVETRRIASPSSAGLSRETKTTPASVMGAAVSLPR